MFYLHVSKKCINFAVVNLKEIEILLRKQIIKVHTFVKMNG